MKTQCIILIGLILISMISISSAITVSMSSNSASISQTIQMPNSSSLKDFATLSEGSIYHETAIQGDAALAQTASGGGKSFSTNAIAPDLKSTQIATESGISGSVSSGSETLFSPSDEEFLATNPDLAMTVGHLSVGGKPVIISGGAYPVGGVDLTEPYYIDPAQTFKFTTFAANYVDNPNPGGQSQNWQMVRNSITKDEAAWNAAAGKPIFDGTITTNSYRSGYDGINAIYPSGGFALGTNLMRTTTIYNTATRKGLDVDIAINLDYQPNLWQSQAILDTVMLHEFGHALGMKHNPYSGTSVMRPLFDYSQAGLSGDDKAIVNAKYNN